MAGPTKIVVKRSSTAGKTPNTSDPSNTSYIAAGELALNMTDKVLYTSDGSSLIAVGATQTTIQASTVALTDNITIGNISTSQLVVNSTAVFAGNSTVNSSVNTTAIAVRDPDHYSAIAADIISVSNTQSNSKLTPAIIFVGNNTVNAQFNVSGTSASLTVSSYSYDNTTGLVTFTTSSAHGFTLPLRGTSVVVSGLTGRLASLINSKTFDVVSIPTTTSFTILINTSFNIINATRTNGVATLTTSAAHGYSVGDSIVVTGAGTDTLDSSLTFDGTQTLITGTTGSTLVYSNNPWINATPTSMYINAASNVWSPPSATNISVAVFNKASHGFSNGQYLSGTSVAYANVSANSIGYYDTTNTTDVFVKFNSSIANVFAVGMKLTLAGIPKTSTGGTTTSSATITSITVTYYGAGTGAGGSLIKVTTYTTNAPVYNTGGVNWVITATNGTYSGTYPASRWASGSSSFSITESVTRVSTNVTLTGSLGTISTSYGTPTVYYGGNFTGTIAEIIDDFTIRIGSRTTTESSSFSFNTTDTTNGKITFGYRDYTVDGSNVNINQLTTTELTYLANKFTNSQYIIASDNYSKLSAAGTRRVYQVVSCNTVNFIITPYDSSYLTTLSGFSNKSTYLPTFVPLKSVGTANASYSDNRTYTSVPVTVVNTSVFSLPLSGQTLQLSGYFGNSSSPITLSSGTISRNTNKALATTAAAKAIVPTISTTSVSGVTANSNFSSYVEIANTTDAIKVTPRTFYIGNTSANLYSNSSFLGISASDSLFQVSPTYMFIGKASSGIPNLTSGSYFYANSTSTYIGNATKYTVFDGAGNQINKGSSITITNDVQTTYIDDNSVTLTSDNAQTNITPYSATFGGNVAIAGALSVQGTYGNTGDLLYSDGSRSYWGPAPSVNTNQEYTFNNKITIANDTKISGITVFSGDVYYQGNTTGYNASDGQGNSSLLSAASLLIYNDTESVTQNTNTLSISSDNATVITGNTTVNAYINSTSLSFTANSSTAYTSYNPTLNTIDTVFV